MVKSEVTNRGEVIPNVFKDISVHMNRSSLPLHVALHFNALYSVLFFLSELLVIIFKGLTLPYKMEYFVGEILLLPYFAVLEGIRVYSLKRSNILESIQGMGFSVFLLFPAVILCMWIMLWQTYILYFEVILTVTLLVFLLIELILTILCMINFSRT